MREALLYEQLDDQVVLCRLCPWDCRIAPGESARCLVRQNREGKLETLNYGLISAAAIEPVERRGVYHLFPGSLVLMLGGWGSNLSCRHRREARAVPDDETKRRYLDSERAIEFALERRCRGVAWGYQEPGVWLEYVLDTAKLAKANGLFTMMITNGMISKEALDLLGPYLDAYVVEIVGAAAAPYESLCELPHWEAILDTAVYARERWNCHVEVHTPLILGINREDTVIRGLASWIRDQLGMDTPWHVWGIEPEGDASDFVPTSMEDLEWAQQVGVEAGLQFIYVQEGDHVGLTPTLCPSCGQILIQREGNFFIKSTGLRDGNCSRCGQEIRISRTIFK